MKIGAAQFASECRDVDANVRDPSRLDQARP